MTDVGLDSEVHQAPVVVDAAGKVSFCHEDCPLAAFASQLENA